MATFPCASGCGFVSQRCNIHSLSGRHLNIFLLSLCWLLIMWMQGLLCFLLRAFAWDYFIIIFESDNSLNIKQRAVRSSACHLSPFQWVSSDFFFIPLLHPFDVLSSEAFLSPLPPFSFGMSFCLPVSLSWFLQGRSLNLPVFFTVRILRRDWCCRIAVHFYLFLKAAWSDISLWYFTLLVLYKATLNFLAKKFTLFIKKSLMMIFFPFLLFMAVIYIYCRGALQRPCRVWPPYSWCCIYF